MRRVSGLERIWLAAERIHAPFANCFVLERGFEAERLRRAVGLVSAAHPGARVVRRGRRWVVGDAPIPVREGPVDPDAPLIAPCEVVAEPTRTAIRSRHAVMDGGAMWGLLEDLLRALQGEAPLGAEAGPTVDFELARRVTRTPRPDPPPDAAALLAASTHTGPVRSTFRAPIETPVRQRLMDTLFALGATRIGVPVDLRRHAPDLRSDANLTGVCHVSPDHPLDPDDAAGHVLAAHGTRWVPLWLMERLGRSAKGSPVSATLSYLGRRTLTVDGERVPLVVYPPYSPGMPLFVAVVADEVDVCVSVVAPGHRAGGLESLVERLKPG